MTSRILTATAVLASAFVLAGATPVKHLGADSLHHRVAQPSQFIPPLEMSGKWHLSEQLSPTPNNAAPPLANTRVTLTRGPGCSYYANDPCYTSIEPGLGIVVSVFVSPRGLLLSGYRTVGTYQRSLASRIENNATQPLRFTTGTWIDAEGRTGTFSLVPCTAPAPPEC